MKYLTRLLTLICLTILCSTTVFATTTLSGNTLTIANDKLTISGGITVNDSAFKDISGQLRITGQYNTGNVTYRTSSCTQSYYAVTYSANYSVTDVNSNVGTIHKTNSSNAIYDDMYKRSVSITSRDYSYQLGPFTGSANNVNLTFPTSYNDVVYKTLNLKDINFQGGRVITGYTRSTFTATSSATYTGGNDEWGTNSFNITASGTVAYTPVYSSNNTCSFSSLETLTLKNCSGPVASLSGPVSKNITVQDSNLVNLTLSNSNNSAVTYTNSNISGNTSVTGTIQSLSLTGGNLGNSNFSTVTGPTTVNGTAANNLAITTSGSLTLKDVDINTLTINHSGRDVNMTGINSSDTVTYTRSVNAPFELKDWTVNKFNLTYTSTNSPVDTAVNPDSTSTQPVARLEKIRTSGASTITGSNDSYLYIKQCTLSGTTTFVNNQEVFIDGGTYRGSPAVTGNNVTIKRGVFTDTSGVSKFMVDADSEASVTP